MTLQDRLVAMPNRLVIDLDEGAPGRWPLGSRALEDLRWYLEDYLRVPFGVYEDRGARIEAALAGWGREVFEAAIPPGPARDAYTRARGSGDLELILCSRSPELLGLPWELMADPADEAPLALRIGGVTRSLPSASEVPEASAASEIEDVPLPRGRLRVLMVICRPAGTRDVGYRMIARPLLGRLALAGGQVDLVVLRPPTFAALRAELAAASEANAPYQVVHFDGHGVFLGAGTAAGGEGALVFEGPRGGPQYVPAPVIAAALRDARVPVAVLNACQSGAVGKELEAAIATSLLVAGVAAVVAMAYSVYSVAAAEFMTAFYERLFAGGTVAAAVAAGRRQLARRPGRPSPKGDLALADWLVPVHYGRVDVRFPQAAVASAASEPALAAALEAASVTDAARESGRGPIDPADGVFVGRDDLFYELEVAARQERVIILAGPGGAGKTELAKAFGRWWRDTGGVDRPGWVFFHSFEPGLASFGLDGVITEIGLQLYGIDFAALAPPARRAAVLAALSSRKMLLIWDNFESVRSFSDPATGLDEAGLEQLRSFVRTIAASGPSALLITSRAPEDWLGDVRRVAVAGLASQEAAEYAGLLLAPYPAARERRSRRAFGELMAWLQGNPLAMRLVLPGLDRDEPEALLAQLRGTAAAPGDGAPDGRASVLAASIGYSYRHLTERARELLPALCLVGGAADAAVLGGFSAGEVLPPGLADVPRRFSGARKDDWAAVLDEATGAGLLTSLGQGLYEVHPALPGYLAARWREAEAGRYDAARDATLRALAYTYASWGAYMESQVSGAGDAGVLLSVIGFKRRMLIGFLGHAVAAGWWDCALGLTLPLWEYWKASSLDTEAGFWADRLRRATETPQGAAPPLSSPPGALWLTARVMRGELAWRREQLGEAEQAYGQVIAAISREPALEPEFRAHYLAIAYYALGQVEQGKQQFGRAEDWFRRSLALSREQGNRPKVAAVLLQLGIVAQLRGRLRRAEDLYRQALTANVDLGNAQLALAVCYQLGRVAQEQGRLDAADEWFRQALPMARSLGDARHISNTLHQIGQVAQDQGRLAVAEEWYRQALAISEEIGDLPGIARSYSQLGMLADMQGAPHDALAWTVRGAVLLGQFPHPALPALPHNLSILAGRLGMAALEACWQEVTGNPLPAEVRSYVRPAAVGSKLRRRLGITAPADRPPPVPG